ncbi:hypothetical protein KIPE111705_21440 [Kibdelosporangium persicum]|uniref:Lipoprotein n=1 Tax=Kibdelosporangium persicum TaxID=2698649 RepID=A0ABX2EW01_9PSEU|nr:hypothetical protein [Kibdelosporangium persicum]NRN62938.1 hypothetical protein [Kibdelosporangium persicum]
MRRRSILYVVLAVTLGGCASPPQPTVVRTSSPPTTIGTELPVEVVGPPEHDLGVAEIDRLAARADVTAPILDRVLGEIRWDTLVMTRTRGELTASCAGNRVTLRDGATTTCTTTFNGVALQWHVDVRKGSRTAEGSQLYSYTISPPDKVLLLGKRVYSSFLSQNVGEPEPVRRRCDRIPDISAFVVQADGETDTGYRCQFLAKRDEQAFVWTPLQVYLRGNGYVRFYRLE